MNWLLRLLTEIFLLKLKLNSLRWNLVETCISCCPETDPDYNLLQVHSLESKIDYLHIDLALVLQKINLQLAE